MAAQYQQYAGYPQSSPYDSLSAGMNSMSLSGTAGPTTGSQPTYQQQQQPVQYSAGSYYQPGQGNSNGGLSSTSPYGQAHGVSPVASPAPEPYRATYPVSHQPSSQSVAGQRHGLSASLKYPQSSEPAIASQYPTASPAPSYSYPSPAPSQAAPGTPYAPSPLTPYQQPVSVGHPSAASENPSAQHQYSYQPQPAPATQSAQPAPAALSVAPNGYPYPLAHAQSAVGAPVPADAKYGHTAPPPYQQHPQQQLPASDHRENHQPGNQSVNHGGFPFSALFLN